MGQVVIIGISISLEAGDTVTASEGATILGASRPRIIQMVRWDCSKAIRRVRYLCDLCERVGPTAGETTSRTPSLD